MENRELSDGEIRGNAMLLELTAQRNSALDRCAMLVSENAGLRELLKNAQESINKKEPVVLRAVDAPALIEQSAEAQT